MATNPLILLQGEVPNLGRTLDRRQNRLSAESNRESAALNRDIAREGQENMRTDRETRLGDEETQRQQARNNQRLRSVAAESQVLQPMIESAKDSGSTDELIRQLGRRRAELIRQGVDTDETDEAFRMVSEGQLDELSQVTGQAIQSAQARGLIDRPGADIPAAQQAFEAKIAALPEEDQAQARRVNAGIEPRALADQVVMIGNVPHKFNRQNSTMEPVSIAGEVVTPESVAEAKGTVAAGVKAAEQGIKQSGEALQRLPTIRTSIANIDDAIAAIDAGAETGVIASRLPSFRAASIALDNIQNKMGLDVIGDTTFGALSKGELDLALNTALPTGLDGPELRQWLVDKGRAQTKLADELEKAAIYLGKPGNTPAGYLEFQRNTRDTTIEDLLEKHK